jgi:hypothetical protein
VALSSKIKGFGRNLWKEQGILGIPGIPKFLGRFGAESKEGLSKELSGIPSVPPKPKP